MRVTATTWKILIPVTVCGIVGAACVYIIPAKRRPHVIASISRGHATSALFDAKMASVMDFKKQARVAEAAGELPSAEKFYRKGNDAALKVFPGFLTFPLAKLHDRMGKYKDALTEYKQVFSTHGLFSDEAWALARCADLDMLYGSKTDARKEYLAAAMQPSGYREITFSPSGSGEDLSPSAPLHTIRACAYYNAALYWGPQDPPKSVRYRELAISLEPNSALMRFGYSFIAKDPQAQYWLAEKEASGALKAALHRWRSEGNELLGSGALWFVKGVAHTATTRYAPKGPVFTPHITDPILLKNPRWAEDDTAAKPVP